jgi:hypothetical protein
MYYYYFNLPKNDKNDGTVFLPHKKSTGLPVIISCYGWNVRHWPKRVEESLRTAANKRGLACVTMNLHSLSDDASDDAHIRRSNNLADMVSWVKAKDFADAAKVGVFAYGAAAKAALGVSPDGLAFSVLTVENDNADVNIDNLMQSTKTPILFLQGTSEKITFPPEKIKADKTMRQNDETQSAHIIFNGSDYFLYNIADQATGEILTWLQSLGI